MNNIKRGLVVFTIVFSIFLVCCANVSALDKKVHFYRFWNDTPGKSQHFYTSDKAEKARINMFPSIIDEGIAGYLYTTADDGRVPLYRLYNSTNGTFIYTIDETEKNNLAASGWTYEKIEGYVYTTSTPGDGRVPLYHFYEPRAPDNFYTTSDNERDKILSRPYLPWNESVLKGIECYIGNYTGNGSNQIIMSLYSPFNSHAGNWSSMAYQTTLSPYCDGIIYPCSLEINQNEANCEALAGCATPPCCTWVEARDIYKRPGYDIYYDEIFDYPYEGAGDPHACTGSNKVLELYQGINSHAQVAGGSLDYPADICYGDLECQTKTDPTPCDPEYKTVVRLLQEENSHVSNSSDTNYPVKVCCKTNYAPISGQIYWADMRGNLITEADVGDTVLMIYENHAAQSFSFNIKEDDSGILDPDDNIDTISTTFDYGSHLAAKWTITPEMYDSKESDEDKAEFYFRVMSGGTQIGRSGELNVSKPTVPLPDTDSPPNAIITNPAFTLPQDQRRFKVNQDINFAENSWDIDDSLKITWEFGDGSTISCNWPEEDCDKPHPYIHWGTKAVYLRAEEIGRSKKASNYTEVYIYDAGTNVFAIINMTKDVFRYVDLPIRFNASQSYVSKCQTGSCPAGFTCYPGTIVDLYCYDRPKFGATGIGTGAGQYNLWFNWTLSNGETKYGDWLANYTEAVDFTKYLFNPQRYKAYLNVGYEEFP